MSQINPFTYVAVQNIEAQRRGVIEKERQLRRQNAMEKDIAAREDTLEHQVESTEEVTEIGDEHEQQRRRPTRRKPNSATAPDANEDDEPHIDLTA